jgi:hypothetical protein
LTGFAFGQTFEKGNEIIEETKGEGNKSNHPSFFTRFVMQRLGLKIVSQLKEKS